MRITLSVHARRDLSLILTNIAQDNTDAAKALNARFNERLNQLAHSPKMGRPRPEIADGMRGLLVSPYVIFYLVQPAGIFVVRVLHGSRDLRQALTETP